MSLTTHQPEKVKAHAGRFQNGTALIVLGGPSAAGWEALRDEVQPDVIIGANGAWQRIPDLDYWVCAENMSYPARQAGLGEAHYQHIMEVFANAQAKVRLVDEKSFRFLRDRRGAIRISRFNVEVEELQNVSFRDYHEGGLINGARMQRPEIIKDWGLGTVGLQCLNVAGILGCEHVHSIGFDMLFREGEPHHWYPYPDYLPETRFHTEAMYTTHLGVKTRWDWVDSAQYLKEVEPVLLRDGIFWKDHSEGLLALEGVAQ